MVGFFSDTCVPLWKELQCWHGTMHHHRHVHSSSTTKELAVTLRAYPFLCWHCFSQGHTYAAVPAWEKKSHNFLEAAWIKPVLLQLWASSGFPGVCGTEPGCAHWVLAAAQQTALIHSSPSTQGPPLSLEQKQFIQLEHEELCCLWDFFIVTVNNFVGCLGKEAAW